MASLHGPIRDQLDGFPSWANHSPSLMASLHEPITILVWTEFTLRGFLWSNIIRISFYSDLIITDIIIPILFDIISNHTPDAMYHLYAEIPEDHVAHPLQMEILTMDAKFKRACEQVLLINTYIQSLQCRYDRASKNELRTYREFLRLRICTAEGIRNVFYQYATQLADTISVKEDTLRQLGFEPIVLYPEADEDMDLWADDCLPMLKWLQSKKALFRATK